MDMNLDLMEEEEIQAAITAAGEQHVPFIAPGDYAKADWVVRKVKGFREDHDRCVDIAKMQIKELQDRIAELDKQLEDQTRFYHGALAEFFETVDAKETKTQKSYKLLSGSLVYKKPSVKLEHSDDLLAVYCWSNDLDEYVENRPHVKWAELKKRLQIVGDQVVDTETGAVVEGVTVEEVPASFDIK